MRLAPNQQRADAGDAGQGQIGRRAFAQTIGGAREASGPKARSSSFSTCAASAGVIGAKVMATSIISRRAYHARRPAAKTAVGRRPRGRGHLSRAASDRLIRFSSEPIGRPPHDRHCERSDAIRSRSNNRFEDVARARNDGGWRVPVWFRRILHQARRRPCEIWTGGPPKVYKAGRNSVLSSRGMLLSRKVRNVDCRGHAPLSAPQLRRCAGHRRGACRRLAGELRRSRSRRPSRRAGCGRLCRGLAPHAGRRAALGVRRRAGRRRRGLWLLRRDALEETRRRRLRSRILEHLSAAQAQGAGRRAAAVAAMARDLRARARGRRRRVAVPRQSARAPLLRGARRRRISASPEPGTGPGFRWTMSRWSGRTSPPSLTSRGRPARRRRLRRSGAGRPRGPFRQGVDREEGGFGDFEIGPARPEHREGAHDIKGDVIARENLAVEIDAVQRRRRVGRILPSSSNSRPERLLQRLAGLTRRRQIIAGHIGVAHQQHAVVRIDRQRAHAERHSAAAARRRR